jgi:hypothetical protein
MRTPSLPAPFLALLVGGGREWVGMDPNCTPHVHYNVSYVLPIQLPSRRWLLQRRGESRHRWVTPGVPNFPCSVPRRSAKRTNCSKIEDAVEDAEAYVDASVTCRGDDSVGKASWLGVLPDRGVTVAIPCEFTSAIDSFGAPDCL